MQCPWALVLHCGAKGAFARGHGQLAYKRVDLRSLACADVSLMLAWFDDDP